jgi:hypothetical protein
MVTFARMPKWVVKLHVRFRRAFRRCLGKAFRVSDITPEGVLMLDVGPARRPYAESILVEPDFMESTRPPRAD